jgi:hypothetical protein
MQELEPQFEVSNIFIIFADKGITGSLPGLIHSGVPVCGDHYHLLKEVWPKHFGPHLWPSVEPFLQQMFCHGDFSEYEACFKKAMALPGIRGNTIQEEYLRAIHENPRRYAGYKRRSIPGTWDSWEVHLQNRITPLSLLESDQVGLCPLPRT